MPERNDTWPYDESITSLCRKPENGETQCPEGTWCKNPIDGGLPLSVDNVIDMQEIDYGITNFDNLGWAMLTIFQMMTVEGWTKIMYNLMDSNIQWMSIIFSISLVLITSFFALNILLAILAEENYKHRTNNASMDVNKGAKEIKKLNRSIMRAAKQNGYTMDEKDGGEQENSAYRKIDEPFSKIEFFLYEVRFPKGLCCPGKRKVDPEEYFVKENAENDSQVTERNQNLDIRSETHEPRIQIDIEKSLDPKLEPNGESTNNLDLHSTLP